MKIHIKIVIVLLSFLPMKAYANPETSVFFAFNEYCISKAHNFNSIRATTKALNWPRLDSSILEAMKPYESDRLEGWQGSRDGVRFIFTLNEMTYSNSVARACTIMTYDIDANILNNKIIQSLPVYERETDDSPLSLTYISLLKTEYDVPVKVHVVKSKDPSSTVVKIEMYVIERR